MIPVSPEEVVGALATAQHLYNTGFRAGNIANQKYRQFGEDIRNFSTNLDVLSNVIQRVHYEGRTLDNQSQFMSPILGAGDQASHQVLGNLTATLISCDRLLSEPRYFQRASGIITNVYWYHQVDPEIQRLREQIAVHNIKLCICLKTLDRSILDTRFIQIFDATSAIIHEVGLLGNEVRGEETTDPFPRWPVPKPGCIQIPQQLEDGFKMLTQNIYPDLSIIPLEQGLDAAVYYLMSVTRTPIVAVQSEVRFLVAIIYIMRSAWILKRLRSTQEFNITVYYRSPSGFEQQMDRWGMTIEKLFDQLEEVLNNAFIRLLGSDLPLPPTPDLLAIFEKDRQMWPGEMETTPTQEKELFYQRDRPESFQQHPSRDSFQQDQDDISELGTRIISAHLKSPDPISTQAMQVYRQTGKRFNLVLVKANKVECRERETVDGYDLSKVQIIPSYGTRTWTSVSLDPQTILFRVDDVSPVTRILTFQQTKDMFEFQQTVTGFKVIHDDARVLATSQETKSLFGGSRRQDLCRLQVWLAPVTKLASDVPSMGIGSVSTQPYLTTPISQRGSRRSSQTTFSSSRSPNGSFLTLSPRQSRPKYTPSAFSSASKPSISSRSSVIQELTMPGQGSEGGIFTVPVLPCVVLFSLQRHDTPSRSFLIIDISSDVTIEEELSESPNSPKPRCVLERKGSYLPARRSKDILDPSQWDLSVAGVHKRDKETEAVKKLKHVIVQFDGHNQMGQFMDRFKNVKMIAAKRLGDFMKATG